MWLVVAVAVSSYSAGFGPRLAPVSRSPAPQCRIVTYEREEGDTAPVDVAKVQELIFQRSHHRQDRNFAQADAIQDELLRMGVTVFDRERKWFVGTVTRSTSSTSSSKNWAAYSREVGDDYPVDVAAVESLIDERNAMRKARDWQAADDLRDQLKADFGVYLVDKELKWYVGSGARAVGRDAVSRGNGYDRRGDEFARTPRGGASGASRAGSRMPAYDPYASREDRRRHGKRERQEASRAALATAYTRFGSDTDPHALSSDEVARIQRQVDARLTAKLKRDFVTADQILADLEDMNVIISDDRRLWRADGMPFLNVYHEDGDSSAETPQWIADAIERRGIAKRDRDFDTADTILAQLEAEGIGVDDARRSWRYLPAPTDGYAPPPEDGGFW